MKKYFTKKINPMIRYFLLIAIFSISISFSNLTLAKSSLEIDAAIESALNRFTEEVNGSQAYLDGARGTLVIPRMIKAGVILGM